MPLAPASSRQLLPHDVRTPRVRRVTAKETLDGTLPAGGKRANETTTREGDTKATTMEAAGKETIEEAVAPEIITTTMTTIVAVTTATMEEAEVTENETIVLAAVAMMTMIGVAATATRIMIEVIVTEATTEGDIVKEKAKATEAARATTAMVTRTMAAAVTETVEKAAAGEEDEAWSAATKAVPMIAIACRMIATLETNLGGPTAREIHETE